MLSEWQKIPKPTDPGSYNVRRADSGHPLDFRIGRDYHGRYVFQLDAECNEPNSLELPKMAAVSCHVEPAGSERSRLVLSLSHSADFRNFALMCKSLMLATDKLSPSQSEEGLRQAIEEVYRWQEMLRRRPDRLLSQSERIGLVGELLFLRDVLGDRLGWNDAIKSWKGPSGHEQDFVISDRIFEVKTQVVTADRKIRISSEDQLDPVQGRIFLCNQGISPCPSGDATARTLNHLVSELRDFIGKASSGSRDLFDIALLEACYEERQEYDGESWVLLDRTYYEVCAGFPRIERTDLRPGVESVKYSVRVSACGPFTVSESDAFGGSNS